MKNSVFRYILLLSIGLLSYVSYGQEYNNFEVRYQNNLRGDLTFIGNNILNRDSGTAGEGPNDPYNNQRDNNNGATNNDNSGFFNFNDFKNMQYIDVDGDSSTFSSSTSTFTFEQTDCNLIRYAGLYWSATYPSATANGSYNSSGYSANNVAVGTGRQTDFNQVKFRVPGGAYVDITADEILFDGFTSTDNTVRQNSPYACYADVTGLVTALANPEGDYTVANIRATTGGLTPGGGTTGGWTLIIVYENPTLTGKFITTFDGFARVNGTNTVDINYNGFETIPVGPVIADLGAAALEGDFRITGDGLSIEAASNTGFTPIGNTANPTDNFFNSNITLDGSITTNRTPASTNTLGYDTDIFLLNNPVNSVIPNNETAATFRFSTDGDQYYPFFNSFNIEVIEPNIVLEKRVEDIAGNDITGAGVNLGQFLDYVLSFQNIGNDDAVNYTIRDILPINVRLDETNLNLPAGVTYTYTPATREVIFTIPDNLVEENDPASGIRMRVQVAENCFDFIDACTDQIENVAFSTYQGEINNAVITDDPSVNDFDACGFVTPGATNFLLDDLDACDFSRTVQLCGDSLTLDAGDNFDAYFWYVDENNDGLIDAGDTLIAGANTDTLVVTEVGTYIVDKQVADPCKGFQEIITVTLFGATQSNPITALINDTTNTVEGQVVVCPNDGEELPEIFLCGLNDTELIQINIPDADSIEWERLDEASCTAATQDCANKNNTCRWDAVGTGGDFTAADAGQYRVVINYLNGCFSRFFFNIFKNPLDPQFNSSDIICNTPGNITVTNMPLDYEFQLVDATNGTILVPYSANNGPNFSIATNGAYRVEMRQQGVVDGCVFVLDNIGILDRDFQVDVDTRDTDCNGLGEIEISVLNVEAQYYYEISQGGTSVDTFGPSNDNNYTFENLNDGVYDVLVTTDDGCNYTEQVTINDVSDIAVSAITTKNIDCEDGIITVTGSGGFPNPNYSYAIWSYNGAELYSGVDFADQVSNIPPGAYQTLNDFTFTNGEEGDYQFIVVDGNNCPALSNIVTIVVSPSVVYTTALTDETCFGAADGSFSVNVTNSNGYALSYTLTLPDTSTLSNVSGTFTGLGQGDYSLTITQTQGAISCDFIETFTIGGPADAVTGTAAITQDYTCTQDAVITVQTASGGTAPYEYSIDGVNFDGTAGGDVFANLTDGTYTISIRDANGCIFVTPDIVIAPLNPPTDLTFTATSPVCPALVSDVTATVVNGNAPFVFEIIAPSAIVATSTTGPSADFDGLSPDTYTFRVTDAKNCVYEESFTITPVSPITVVGQLVSNITCFDDTDGEARFTIANFNTSYDYTVTGPSNFSGTNATNGTIDLTNLDDGAYTINVTDNDTNCTATATVTINGPPAAITVTATTTQPTCTTDGSVQITAAGGWGSYTYVLNNPDTTPVATNTNGTFNNLTQYGVYNGTVADINGCVEPFSFELFEAFPPVLTITPDDFCYDNATGLTLTATVTSGGDGNYEYSLNNGPFDTPNVFTGLGSGTYRVDVRDGNNCTDFATITINPELSVTASASNITACATATDVNVTAAGGDGNYVYAIVADGASPGTFSATNPISVTGAGDYDVYVRDNSGNTGYCEASFDLIITQDPPLAISVSNTDILCSGSSTSTITITASGGEAPYRYSIDNGATYETTNTFVNQAAGSYNIRVLDANNCDITQTYTITEPFTLSASAAVTALVECNPTAGAEVRITNARGGTAPYEYSFNGGTTYGASAIGFLLEGTHTLFIRDDNDCTFEMTVTVDPQPTPPTLSASVDYECDGEGTITVTPSSTDFDYTYSISVNGGALSQNTPNTSNIFNDVPVGNHTISVDYISNSAPVRSTLLLEDFGTGPNVPLPEIDTDYYCYDPQDGTASPCSPLDGRTTNSGNSRIDDLEYSVTNTIVNPFVSWVSPLDNSGDPNGRYLAINVGDPGVNTIVYTKEDIEIIPNRDVEISLDVINLVRQGSGLIRPNILVEIVDSSGNILDSGTTGLIDENTGNTDWRNFVIPPLDPGANTTIDIVIRTIGTGTNGNDVAIDNIQAFQTPEQCAGTATVDVIVEDGRAFDAEITAFSNISCNAGTDGAISFEVENFDATFEYQVNGSGFSAPQSTSTVDLSGLPFVGPSGEYIIDIRTTDNLGNTCSAQLTQIITQPTPVIASGSITSPVTCNDDAILTSSASGGTPDYEYQLELNDGGLTEASYNIIAIERPFQNAVTFTGVPENAPGESYVIRVRDANGCIDVIDNAIVVDGPELVTFDAVPTACYTGSNNGTIEITVTNGNGGYQFQINGGPWLAPTAAGPPDYIFDNLGAGTYNINVRDSFGCEGIAVPITINPQLNASASLQNNLTCIADATIEVSATGGSGVYTYEWATSAAGPWNNTQFVGNIFTTSTAGDFYFRVTDNTAPTPCSDVVGPITVSPAPNPVITAVTPTHVLCNGESTGSLDVTINTAIGNPPYVIDVIEINGPTNYGTQTTGLPAGDYEVTITDANGCVSSPFPASITEPGVVLPNITNTNLTCTASTTVLGTITVDASGGTGDYFYRVNNNDFSVNETYDTNGNPNSHTFTGLDFGDYTVSVTDDNNCETVSIVTITTGPDVLITTQGAAGCTPGSGEMDVEAQASNGTLGVGTFFFALYPAPTFNITSPDWFPEDTPGSNSHLFTGLTPGVTYTFVVHDTDTNCEYIQEAIVPVASTSTLSSNIDVSTNVTCFGSNDGTVDFTVSGHGGVNVDYEIFASNTNISTAITGSLTSTSTGSAVSGSATGINPGDFYILFTEVDGPNAGCVIASDEFTIQQAPTLLEVIANSPTNDNCNVNAGVITAIGQFGMAPYEYQYLLDTDPTPAVSHTPPTPASAGWTSSTTANVEAGDYRVYIKDANDCIQFDDVTVLLDPSPEISLSIIDECVEEGNFQVTITLDQAGVTTTTPPSPPAETYLISVNGGGFQTVTFTAGQYVLSHLSSGLGQTIAIQDLNGCGETENLDIQVPLEFTVIQTVALDCEPGVLANAEIEINVTSGSGNYEYLIDGPGSVGVATRTALPPSPFTWTGASAAGPYAVTIFDLGTTPPNCFETITIDIPDAVLPDFSETNIDVTCNGGTDGSITLTQVDNGINPLTYTLTPMPVGAVLNGNTFENLPAGFYDVRGTGTNNCFTDIFNIEITEPALITVPAPTVVEFGCTAGNNTNNASITVNNIAPFVQGGSGAYTIYEFINDQGTPADTTDDIVEQSGSNTVYTETNTAGGTYIINVYDDNGCVGTTTATILPYDQLLTATATYNNDLSCNPGSDGSITIGATSTTNNTSRFEYSIDNGANYQTSNTFNGLDAGTHNFLVRHVDTGCIITASETIAPPDVLELDLVNTSNIICFGSATGSADFDLNDGAGTTYASPIDYVLYQDVNNTPTDITDDVTTTGNDTDGLFTINSLATGTYYIEVTEANFPTCTYTQSFTITSPSAAITGDTEVTQITCATDPAFNDGVIEVIDVAGGWGGYQYYVSTTPNPDEFDSSNYVSSPRFENLVAGTYEIWIIDQFGCPEQLPHVILANPTPIVADLQINNYNCINLQGEIEVVGIPATNPVTGGQGSNYTYQLIRNGTNIGSPQNTTIFSDLGAGSYEVYIIDQWGCDTTVGPVVLTDAMTATASVVKPIDCSVDPGGHITITVNGGSSNLDYTVTYPDLTTTVSQNNGVFTNLTQAGEYVFVVTDLDTATPCTVAVRQTLDAPVNPVLLDAIIENVSCFGGVDGSITAVLDAATATNPNYTYELYRTSDLVTPIRTAQASPLFENLNADSYQVRVISGRGCEDTKIETVTQPTELLIDAIASIFTCAANNTVNTATITVAILDGATTPGTPSGTSPYLYSIDNVNFQTSNIFEIIDNGTDQTITVFVTDGESCPATDTVTITALNTFTAAVAENIDISCANPEEVIITVTETGVPGDVYSFELLPISNTNGVMTSSTNTTAVFDLSAVGSYTFRVTNTTTGCYVDTAPYEIAPYDLIDVIATATAPVSCFGTATGALEINIVGYTGNYDYQIFDSSNNPFGGIVSTDTSVNPRPISNIPGGNYFVRVTETDVPLCTEDSNTITIVSPAAPLSTSVSVEAPPTCDNDQGEILVTPTGGYAPYGIVLTNTTTGQIYTETNVNSFAFTGLSAGSFTIEVSDSGAVPCIDNETETIAPAIRITADITATPTTLLCYGDTNAIVTAINVLNGEGVYLYQLNEYDVTGTTIAFTSGAQSNPSFGNLGAGIYSITVSDGWNCDVETVQVTISEPTDVMASLIQLTQLTCTNDAEIQLTASGGTGPYEYSVDGSVYTAMSGGNSDTFSVTSGVYQYYVRDDFGCEAMISNQVTVDPVPPLTITIDDSAAFINCTGEASATIIVNVTGGLGNYNYELYSDAALTNLVGGPQTNDTFNGLIAGDYYVRVVSQDCEEVSPVIPIVDPLPLQIDVEEFTNVTCSGLDDGTITVEVSGGTGEILYAITPNLNQFDTVNTFDGLAPGVYDVIAQDRNGCFIPFQFTIDEPQPLNLSTVSVINEICEGDADGSIEIAITGGTAPYSTAFNSNADVDFVQNQTVFTGLAAGTYVIFVRDAQGCEENIIIEIESGVNLNAVVTPVYECFGDTPNNRINVALEDSSISADILYGLDSNPMQLAPDFTNMAPGMHTLTIAHANGCINIIDFEILGFEPLTLTLEQNNINEITAVAGGGLEDYTFYFDGMDNGNDNTYIINRTDTYTVRVVDQNGCETVAQIEMEFIDIEIPNFFTPDGDGVRDVWVPENLEAFPNILTIIFDRYGRELYRMEINDAPWQGIYQGHNLPSGDYWYVIKLKGENDDREFVGHFTLYR